MAGQQHSDGGTPSSRSNSQTATCIGCGCTDLNACIDAFDQPCGWLKVDYKIGIGVCSECPDKLPEFKKHKEQV